MDDWKNAGSNHTEEPADVAQVRAQYADFAARAGARVPQLPCTEGVADQVIALAALDSTMNLSRRMVLDGSLPLIDGEGRPRMAVVCAEVQTAGHGRLGRVWVDKPGASFLVTFMTALPASLLTDPQLNGWFTIEAGLAAIEAIEEAMAECGAELIDPTHRLALKWPNDIFYNAHKLGGILTELVSDMPTGMATLAEGGRAAGVLFGIGLNLGLDRAQLPIPRSTSLQLVYASLSDFRGLRDAIAAGIVRRLRERLARLVAQPEEERRLVLDETKQLCWTLGHEVKAKFTDGSVLHGIATALNPDASLVVEDGHGVRHIVQTADVGVVA